MADEKQAQTSEKATNAPFFFPENEETGAHMYPIRFLGLAFFITWLCLTHISSIYPANPNWDAERTLFDLGMRIGDVGSLALFAIFAPRLQSFSRHMPMAVTTCALSCMGTLLMALYVFPMHFPPAAIIVLSALTAVGGSVLFCFWAQIYSRMSTTQLLVYSAGCCIGAYVLSFFVGNLRQPVAIFTISLMPLCSLFCAWLSQSVLPPEKPAAENVRYPLPKRLIALMTIAALISSISGLQETQGVGGSMFRISATCIVGITLLICTMQKHTIDYRQFARITFPIAVVSVLLIPIAIQPFNLVASFLGKLAYVCFTIFALMIMATICHRYEVPSLRPFACARACSEAAILIGVLSKNTLHSLQLNTEQAFLYAIATICIVLLALCVLIWKREKAVNEDWGACGISLETGARVIGERARYERRCLELAETYKLTEREAEILALLGQDKTRAEIEAELFLSENTIKTHTRHIYQKTGAHSREEIISLIG